MDLTKDKVLELVDEWVHKAEFLFGFDQDINDIQFGKGMTSTAGIAIYEGPFKYGLKFSIDFMEHDPELIINDTIPHEVCHVVSFWLKNKRRKGGDRGHGEGWKFVCRKMGYNPERVKERTTKSPPRTYFRYKDTNGDTVDVNFNQHYQMQNKFKSFKTKNGRVNASGFVEKIKK